MLSLFYFECHVVLNFFDLRQIAHLLQICFPEFPRWKVVSSVILSRFWDRIYWAIRYLSPQLFLSGFLMREFLTVKDPKTGKVIGVASLVFRGLYQAKTWSIGLVCVRPEYRRSGIGTTLLESALSLAKRKKAEFAFLSVRSTNLIARKIYESLGFKAIGEYGDWVFMQIKL